VNLRIRRPSFFGVEPAPRPTPPETVETTFAEVKRWLLDGSIRRHLFRYHAVELQTANVSHVSKPFPTALMLRLLSRGRCSFVDDAGQRVEIGAAELFRFGLRFARDLAGIPWLLAQVRRDVRRLAAAARTTRGRRGLDLARSPLYLRGDLLLDLRSGGSVGHIAGVLNNLDRFTGRPLFVTSAPIPTVRPDIETHVVTPGPEFCGFEEVPALHFNAVLAAAALEALAERPASFVYQRYGVYGYSGLALSRRLGVPFVLEYNGSEVWISRHWGKALRFRRTAALIEGALLGAADLIVVVSRPIRDALLAQGIAAERILVDPNGVDPDRYSPSVDGSAVRRRYALEEKRVIGFIGSFGRWHGAEVLAEAFGRLMGRRPEWRESVRLLMIGDGLTIPEVRANLARHGVSELAVLTGAVPQAEGPEHLAACDVLVSPHVRNPDGTPFFGSPTKLFEYMAMGRGIVASNLDQIGDVLCHGETAWLVEPGDVDALAGGIERLLADDGLARTLAGAARAEALARHTWRDHTRRIVEALVARCAGAAA
jgi:glycosyltransferase involved in cell wall biosynthesis